MSGAAGRGVRPRTVADLMRREVVAVSPDATVAELARTFLREDIAGAPVVDAHGKPVGTVSVTDLLWLLDRIAPTALARVEAPDWQGLADKTVRDIMTPDVFGVAPATGLAELLAFFSRTGLHRAVVLEGERIVGIVSVSDLLGLVAGEEPRASSTA